MSVAFPRLDVKFFGFHAGVNLGEDGASQQSVEDLGIMQAIPGVRVYSPCDAQDLEWSVQEAIAHEGPTYTRPSAVPIAGQTGVWGVFSGLPSASPRPAPNSADHRYDRVRGAHSS